MTESPQNNYGALTPLMMLQLAAPHTWPAAILPCFVAFATASVAGPVSLPMAFVLLAICILMQASANTFNDYFDYVKGTDTAEDNVDPTDSVLVYNNVNPQHVKVLGIIMLVVAFGLGAYVIVCAGWIPLVFGCVGAVIVVAYSAGKTPLSYLPVGELVSGIAFGCLIPLACYQALTGLFNWAVIAWSVPTTIAVGLIMLTNNTCDIEKDIEARRRTLPALIGRAHARTLYHACVFTWFATICLVIGLWFTPGLPVCVFMVLAGWPVAQALWRNPLTPRSRIGAMGQIASLNVVLGAFYGAAVLACL